jgi:diguanylate cyclase
LNSIGEGVVATDLDGRITIASKVALDMAGWKKDEALGKHFDDVFLLRDEMTNEPVENLTNKVFRMGRRTTLTCNYVIIGRRGTRTPISNSAAPIIGEDGKTLGVVMAFRDISKDKIDSDRILYISYHDYLTGLYNRRFLEEYIEKATYSDQLPISVIVGDINGLKLTNDIFGHDMGDKLLVKAAEIIKMVCPHEGVPARWGGDEFIILLPHTEEAIAETIVRKIKTTCEIELDSTMRVSLSLGYATKGSTVIDIRETIRKAEEYMYRHKLLDGKSYHNALIHTLLATLCEKSIETEQHTKRLSDLCYAFGLMINLQSNELDELSLLALLHDIGKVGIRQSILKKPGKLTDDEWGEMKQHPAIGYRIAKSTTELSGVADYILYHHERWDGSGYPQRLKGNEIPLNCRVLALADAYDAMTSDRVYRKAMTQSEAIAELRKNAGTQFDPKLVEPFISTVLSIEILNSF